MPRRQGGYPSSAEPLAELPEVPAGAAQGGAITNYAGPNFHKIAVKSVSDTNPMGFCTQVTLDGKPLMCHSLRLDVEANGINRVTVTLDAVVDIDLPADITVTREIGIGDVNEQIRQGLKQMQRRERNSGVRS